MKVRVTGILIENESLLVLDQDVNAKRKYSLPGGMLEEGETLESALVREMKEETGLDVAVGKLIYITELIESGNHVVHLTFHVKNTGGVLGSIAEGLDTRVIRNVEFIPFEKLQDAGFSETFVKLVKDGFPDSGNYMGAKNNIGL